MYVILDRSEHPYSVHNYGYPLCKEESPPQQTNKHHGWSRDAKQIGFLGRGVQGASFLGRPGRCFLVRQRLENGVPILCLLLPLARGHHSLPLPAVIMKTVTIMPTGAKFPRPEQPTSELRHGDRILDLDNPHLLDSRALPAPSSNPIAILTF